MMKFRVKITKIRKNDKWIRKGVIKPNDPRENGTTGGIGPLNNDAACTKKLN